MTIGKPFQKGRSGNPGGRPKVVAEVKELARAHTREAIETLVSIMSNPKAAPAARVSAANALLDRGYEAAAAYYGRSRGFLRCSPARACQERQGMAGKPGRASSACT